jgi:hypothetical protein
MLWLKGATAGSKCKIKWHVALQIVHIAQWRFTSTAMASTYTPGSNPSSRDHHRQQHVGVIHSML